MTDGRFGHMLSAEHQIDYGHRLPTKNFIQPGPAHLKDQKIALISKEA